MRETGTDPSAGSGPEGAKAPALDAQRYLARVEHNRPKVGEGTGALRDPAAEVERQQLRDRLEGIRAEPDWEHFNPEQPVEVAPIDEFPLLSRQLRQNLERARRGVEQWGPPDQALAHKWFGLASPPVRERLRGVIARVEADIGRIELLPLEDDQDPDLIFAYVRPGNRARHIHVGKMFIDAGSDPPDSRAGILVHEMTHFADICGTSDLAYGHEESEQLASSDPPAALRNADNFEYFVEEYYEVDEAKP